MTAEVANEWRHASWIAVEEAPETTTVVPLDTAEHRLAESYASGPQPVWNSSEPRSVAIRSLRK